MTMKLGQEVLSCSPFAYVVSQSLNRVICDNCLSHSDDDVVYKKCGGCKFVHYCCVGCQKAAWKGHHRPECVYMRRVPQIPSDTVRLIARIILKLQNGGLCETASLPDGQKRRFDDLMSHQKSIVRDTKRMEAFEAFFSVLKVCFSHGHLPQKYEILDIYGKILVNSFNIMDNDYQPIGIGLYLAASVLDHSCQPNSAVVFNGKQLALRVTEAENEEFSGLKISYINVLYSTHDRKRELKQQYYFDCTCPRCTDEDDQQPRRSSVRCTNCSSGCVPISSGVCDTCKTAVSGVVKEKHAQLKKEVKEKMFDNLGGHPEPEVMSVEYLEDMKKLFHPYDKTYLDVLEAAYEQHIGSKNFEAALEAAEDILVHYQEFYPRYDVNKVLMEMKVAKLQTYLFKFPEAEQHLEEAKKLMEVTHGFQHTLFTKTYKNLLHELMVGKHSALPGSNANLVAKSG